MLKNLLKYSVSVLVLLGTIANINPSHAGNAGLGGKKQTTEEERGILVPFKGNPRATSLFIQPFKESEDNLSPLPQDVWLIAFTHLDYESILNAQQVCKNWAWIIFKTNNAEDVNHLILHPTSLFQRHHQFAPLCSSALEFVTPQISSAPCEYNVYLEEASRYTEALNKFLIKMKSVENRAAFAFIDNISNHLCKDNPLGEFLVRKYISLDPCQDFREVYLASNIVSQSPELQDSLRKVVSIHNFDFDHIPADLMNSFWQVLGFHECTIPHPESFQDYQDLQQSLMALKLLSLCGDETAQDKLQKFGEFLCNNVACACPFTADDDECWGKKPVQFIQDRTKEQYHFFSNYLKWAAYVNDLTGLDDYIAQFYTNLYFCPKVILDPQIVKSFGASCNLASLPIPYFSPLLHIYGQQDNRREILNTLAQYYKSIDKSDLWFIVVIAHDYQNEEEYAQALSILTEASERHEDTLIGDLFKLEIAKCILAAQDQQNFPLSKEYIHTMLSRFQEGKKLLRVPFPDEMTCNINVWRHEIFCKKAVLDIYEGDFLTAYQALKTAYEMLEYLNEADVSSGDNSFSEDHSSGDIDSELSYWCGKAEAAYTFEHVFTNGLIQALETQILNPDFPRELLFFIAQKVSHLVSKYDELDYEDQRIFKKLVFKHQDVLRHILHVLYYHKMATEKEHSNGLEDLQKLLDSM